jgi:glutamate formiminotransferase
MIYESVINVSTSDSDVVSEITTATGPHLVDVHSDRDHNRSVFTIASRQLADVERGVASLVQSSFSLLTFEGHIGVHPCLGVIDVIPFVSFDEETVTPDEFAIDAAQRCAQWIFEKFSVPVFLYDDAGTHQQTLPAIRRSAFREIAPDFGTEAHPQYGAVCVGAREPLIAINVNLDSTDVFMTKHIANSIRESNDGIPGVRAIGLSLAHANKMQVSMNVIDTVNTNVGEVCLDVMKRAEDKNIPAEVELVGLVPRRQFDLWSDEFKTVSGLDEKCTVEYHV